MTTLPDETRTVQRERAISSLFAEAPNVRDSTRDEVLSYAHALQDLGLFIFPVAAGGKRPATTAPHGRLDATTDHDALDAMYSQGMNLGCDLGRSRVIVVDMDTTEAVDALRRADGGVHVPETLTVTTPGYSDGSHAGGGHLWMDGAAERYTVPDGTGHVIPMEDDVLTSASQVELASGAGGSEANTAVAMTGGSYVVLPGSVRDDVADSDHPAYEAHGSVLGASNELARRVLRQVLKATHRKAENKASAEQRRAERERRAMTGEPDPIDVWEESTPWADILEPHGWTVNETLDNKCGCPTVARPDKAAETRSGVAHTHCADTDGTVLYLFTTSTDLPDHRGLSKLQAVAHLEYGGDDSAAMDALGIQAAAPAGTPLSVPSLDALTHADELGTPVAPFAPGLPSSSRWNHPVFSGMTEYATADEAAAGAELLGYVRTVAMDRKLNPYALAVAVLQELSLYVPANVVVSYPSDVGLNLFSMVLGKPAGRKSMTYKTAESMVSLAHPTHVRVGATKTSWGTAGFGRAWHTNEGDSVEPENMHPDTANLHSQRYRQDEVLALLSEVTKPGSGVIANMNKAWMGEVLGAANSDPKNTWSVPAHCARGAIQVAGQVPLARPMFTGDVLHSGATARFLVFLAGFSDVERAERERMRAAGELETRVSVLPTLKLPATLPSDVNPITRLVEYPTEPEVFDLMERLEDEAEASGQDDDLDQAAAHDVLQQRKLATLLAIVCGGNPVNLHWWTMAGFIMDAARADFLEIVRQSNEAQAREARGKKRAALETASDAAAEVFTQRVDTVLGWLRSRATGDGCKWSEVYRNGPAKRWREDLDALRDEVAETPGFTVTEGTHGGWKVTYSPESETS